jgi:hypothetical protein
MMPQGQPKAIASNLAPDPAGRDTSKLSAQMPPTQFTGGEEGSTDLPGDPETESCDCQMG